MKLSEFIKLLEAQKKSSEAKEKQNYSQSTKQLYYGRYIAYEMVLDLVKNIEKNGGFENE